MDYQNPESIIILFEIILTLPSLRDLSISFEKDKRLQDEFIENLIDRLKPKTIIDFILEFIQVANERTSITSIKFDKNDGFYRTELNEKWQNHKDNVTKTTFKEHVDAIFQAKQEKIRRVKTKVAFTADSSPEKSAENSPSFFGQTGQKRKMEEQSADENPPKRLWGNN